MKYFLKIDLPWTAAAHEIKNYIMSNFDINNLQGWQRMDLGDTLKKCRSLNNIVVPLGTEITRISFSIHQRVKRVGDIHTDIDDLYESRLIMPILNCEKSETRFYSTIDEPKIIKQANGIIYNRLDPEKCRVEDKFNLSGDLFLIRIKAPHSVYVYEDSNFPRISCTFATARDFIHLLN